MPLLQGQPFKLIKPPDISHVNSEIYTIQHTGEKFLNKSDYEDRLALYSQSIWTCQCTGHTGLTHKEAWMSEAKVRGAAKSTVPDALQKPLLSLVHHSLSPLEQLIEAASILCHSQYHIDEEIQLLYPKQTQVRVVNSKDLSKSDESSDSLPETIVNGLPLEKEVILLNGNVNGVSKDDSPGTSPGKENQAKEAHPPKDDTPNKKEMLPKIYDVITLEEQKLIENVPASSLLRPYKIPSKDQLRLFIRSCALRHRGSTCTPWVVSDEFVKKFDIPNKLPSLFLSSPKPNQPLASKRKAQSPTTETSKRAKSELSNKPKKESSTKVPPVIVKSENSQPSPKKSLPDIKPDPSKPTVKNNSQHSSASKLISKSSWNSSIMKHPMSLGKPKLFSRPPGMASSQSPLPVSKETVPRKRGRPPLSKEEKERNKKMRQATLFDLSNKITNKESGTPLNIVKVKTSSEVSPNLNQYTYLQQPNPLISASYKSPVKRATTPEAIMSLPFMRRFVHEAKTIKGVLGQFRRYAHTMDLVIAKLSSAQIEMIPDEILKNDLKTRQKKVQDKKFFEKLNPEERKQFLKDKARTVALERWKERKLKNLKIEDQTIPGMLPLPEPTLIETPEPIPNLLFGDIVMVTDFIKCFCGLLLGEEKFRITSTHIMEAIIAGSQGYKVIADIICCLLPTIVHDDISKNCKEIGVPISGIPITYQTAHELSRLCLRKQEEEETMVMSEENYQLGKEKNELSEELMNKLEICELWELSPSEIIAILKALVHKALCTASISVYVEEVEDKVLQTLRERRKIMKQAQKEQKAVMEKKKEERIQNKVANAVPKKQRGRPKGYSPKTGTLHNFFPSKDNPTTPGAPQPQPLKDTESLSTTIQKRRISAEISRKEKAELLKQEKERQKQMDENQKRVSMDRKYEEIVIKRDNLLRRVPIGFDRFHNRYWIFNTTTPGLYVEKGWVDVNTDYIYSMHPNASPSMRSPVKTNLMSPPVMKTPIKVEMEANDEEKPLSIDLPQGEEEDPSEASVLKCEEEGGEENPLTSVKSEIKKEMDGGSHISSPAKSKLTISPMKMTYRGRPPKEAYVLVDEDTQTFPVIEENRWYYYPNMDDIKNLLSSLSDKGQRESQLIAAININKDRLQYHFNKKAEPLKLTVDSSLRLKESLKEDIIQIEKELIEGWLGGVPNFDEWEAKVKEAEDVSTMGISLIEAQLHMQIKYLKSIMSPVKEQIVPQSSTEGAAIEYEDVEGPGVEQWRDAVRSCRTYSRLHVLVGLFDSCIKWEKSMATRKCKVCRSKVKEDPLVMCDKCQINYHWYCLRPPLKEDPGEKWSCPACKPKKTRREEKQSVEQEAMAEEQDEKDDPTFSLEKTRRQGRSSKRKKSLGSKDQIKQEKECSVCYGRIGLISCSKCGTAYHSECHDPPLMSRARKDWVCGACLNPRKGRKRVNFQAKDEDEKPVVRRNYFGNIEEVQPKKFLGNTGPRDPGGRFLRGARVRKMSARMAESQEQEDGEEEEEEEEPAMDKYGRSIRGAKAKALECMTGDLKHSKSSKDSRRSSRNQSRRKNYKDEDEDDEDEDEEEEEGNEEEEDNEDEQDEREEDDSDNEEENDVPKEKKGKGKDVGSASGSGSSSASNSGSSSSNSGSSSSESDSEPEAENGVKEEAGGDEDASSSGEDNTDDDNSDSDSDSDSISGKSHFVKAPPVEKTVKRGRGRPPKRVLMVDDDDEEEED